MNKRWTVSGVQLNSQDLTVVKRLQAVATEDQNVRQFSRDVIVQVSLHSPPILQDCIGDFRESMKIDIYGIEQHQQSMIINIKDA